MLRHSQERTSLSFAALIAPHGCLEICQRVCTIIRYELSLDASIDRKQFPGKASLREVSRCPLAAGVCGSKRGNEAGGWALHGEPEFQGISTEVMSTVT